MHLSVDQTSASLEHDPDHLGDSVLRNLTRTYWNQFSSSAIRCGILGFLTLGLWPLVRLRRQFRNHVVFEKQQLRYLADWTRTRLGGEESAAFADSVKRIGYRRRLQWMQTWCLIGIVAVMISHATGGTVGHEAWERTFGFMRLDGPVSGDSVLIPFVAWNVGLAAAYGLHWLQIRRHRASVSMAVTRFEAVARREGIDPGPAPAIRVLTDFKWGGVALILSGLGGFWATVMALAGAAQRRYINVTTMTTRGRLLGPVRAIHAKRRPVMNSQNYTIHARRCENALCRASLPAGARFCTRCGRGLTLSDVA